MAVNFKGRDYKLYLSATTPATATFASSYTLCGNLTNVSLSTSRNAIDVSTKDAGDNSAFVSGRRSTTMTGSALFDHVVDAGQTVLYTALAAEGGTVFFLISDSSTLSEEFYGSGVITQYDVAFPDDDATTLDFTIQVSGAITQAQGNNT